MTNDTHSRGHNQVPPQVDDRTVERAILLYSLISRRFFQRVMHKVAPVVDPSGRIFRRDFGDRLFQVAYEGISATWRTHESLADDRDYRLPLPDLDAQLAFAVVDHKISEEDSKKLLDQIKDELKDFEFRPELMDAFLNGAPFNNWLAARVVYHAVNKLNAKNVQGVADLDALREALEEAEASIGSHDFEKVIVEPLMSIDNPSEGDEVIGPKRFGIRGALVTFIGRTGIGKSSFTLQLAISFAMGRPAFGFVPNGKIKVLIIQAENDAGDIAAMRDGIVAGLGLTADQKQEVAARVFVAQVTGLRGSALVRKLKPVLATYKPDLLILDPALAFLEGDVKEQKDVGKFLRQEIWPLGREYKCLVLISHHTNRPPAGKDATTWQASDYAYYGSGSAEWANIPRGVITLSPKSTGVFELAVPKRGQRLGWTESDSVSPTTRRFVRHTKIPGRIFWEEATPQEIQETKVSEAGRQAGVDSSLVLMVVMAKGRISQEDLFTELREKKLSEDRARKSIKALLEAGKLIEEEEPRPSPKTSVF